jgi:hypothetical protein
MAHNAYVRAGGIWNLLSVLLSSEMATFDLRQFQSLNGDEGGTWLPASVIIIGGTQGLRVTGPFVATDADITITSGRFMTVNSGGTINALAGSTSNFAGTWNLSGAGHVQSGGTLTIDSGGLVSVASGGATTWASGSVLTTNTGSTANINGAVNIKAGSNVAVKATATMAFEASSQLSAAVAADVLLHGNNTLDGTQTIGGTTSLGGATTVPNGATVAFAAGSAMSANATAPFTLNNIVTCNGSINIATGATCTIQTSGTFVTQSGASVTRGADETQTGAVFLSGTGAYTELRQTSGAATDHTYNLTDQDVIEVPNLGADTAYTFNDATKHARTTVNRWEAAGTNKLELKRGDGSVICTFPSVGGNGCATIYWNGTRIIADQVSGAVTVP